MDGRFGKSEFQTSKVMKMFLATETPRRRGKARSVPSIRLLIRSGSASLCLGGYPHLDKTNTVADPHYDQTPGKPNPRRAAPGILRAPVTLRAWRWPDLILGAC